MLDAYEHEDAEQLTESVETVVGPVRELIAEHAFPYRDRGPAIRAMSQGEYGPAIEALDADVELWLHPGSGASVEHM